MNKFDNLIRNTKEQEEMFENIIAQLDIDSVRINKIERGGKNVKQEYVFAFAKALNIKLEELLNFCLADEMGNVVENESQLERAIKIALNHITGE